MTISRGSRAVSAFMRGAEEIQSKPEPNAEERPLSGNWSRQAMRGLEERLTAAKSEAEHANETLFQGILDGQIPLLIPTDRIEDRVGTDRIASPADGPDEDSFAALLANIKERGQRQPIRVRPVDPRWRPDRAFPRDVTGQRFTLQSGRRRLRALQELGRDALCFLSFVEEDAARLDDLKERFFENSSRKNLSSFERLYSIGLIAKETRGTTQAQIADIIGVSGASVSRGVAVVEFRDRLTQEIDLTQATVDDIDAALKQIRGRAPSENPEALRSRERRREKSSVEPLPFRKQNLSIGTLRLRNSSSGGRILTIDSPNLTDDKLQKLLKFIEKL